jgi:hypothetical protein
MQTWKNAEKTNNLGLNGTDEPGVKLNFVFLCKGLIIASPKGEANNRIRRKKKAMSLCLYVCM